MAKSKKIEIGLEEIPSLVNPLESLPIPPFPSLKKLEGFEQFRQTLLQEMEKFSDRCIREKGEFPKIDFKEVHNLLIMTFERISEFLAVHMNNELAYWLLHREYEARSIPFDLKTARQVRENVLHLGHKLYEIHKKRAENDHA